jgi:ComF family protein
MPSDESPIASMPDLDAVASVFQYEGRAAQAIRNLKYHRITSLARPMSRLMAQTLEQQSWDIDLVVPVPIHFSRRCARGFNQAELLCEAISQSQSKKSLLRIRRTPPQVGLSRDRRLTNLIGAFRAMPEVADKSVLLVDDVITTGTTASECARMLRTAGASRVFGLVFARG